MSKRYAVIVTGDRHARASEWEGIILDVISSSPDIDNLTVLHGGCTGIDTIADNAIRRFFPSIPVIPYYAKWDIFRAAGNPDAAGPVRNGDMLSAILRYREAGYDVRVLAFHNFLDNSTGTKNMVKQARQANVPVKLFTSRD